MIEEGMEEKLFIGFDLSTQQVSHPFSKLYIVGIYIQSLKLQPVIYIFDVMIKLSS